MRKVLLIGAEVFDNPPHTITIAPPHSIDKIDRAISSIRLSLRGKYPRVYVKDAHEMSERSLNRLLYLIDCVDEVYVSSKNLLTDEICSRLEVCYSGNAPDPEEWAKMTEVFFNHLNRSTNSKKWELWAEFCFFYKAYLDRVMPHRCLEEARAILRLLLTD